MSVLSSNIDSSSAAFAENAARMTALVEEFRALERKVVEGSAAESEKFARRGQLLPRERIARLLDRGSPFLELATLAGLATTTTASAPCWAAAAFMGSASSAANAA